MFFSYFRKRKGVFSNKKPGSEGVIDIFRRRKTSDYLRYLKWEAFTYGYNLMMLSFTIVASLYS